MQARQVTQIGTKRQLTMPKAFLDYYGLGEGSQLIIEMKEDHLELHPAFPVKRSELPEELREKFLSRRGAKETDVPLDTFLKKIGYETPRPKRSAAASKASARQLEREEVEG